jgi:hypothetical protein
VRPAPKDYNWQPLEAVIRQWILQSKWASWNLVVVLM